MNTPKNKTEVQPPKYITKKVTQYFKRYESIAKNDDSEYSECWVYYALAERLQNITSINKLAYVPEQNTYIYAIISSDGSQYNVFGNTKQEAFEAYNSKLYEHMWERHAQGYTCY